MLILTPIIMKLIYDKKFIFNFYREYLEGTISIRALCLKKNIPYKSIQKVLKKHNLKSKQSVYSQELLYFVYNKHVKEQRSIADIANELKLSRNTLCKKLKEVYGTLTFYKKNGHYIHENYFCNIDTERKAYYLGLIYADGCITTSHKRPTMSISLHKDDDYILKQFALDIGKDLPIYYIKSICTIKIHREKIVQDLIKHGVKYNKSSNGGLILPSISKNLMPHFIRGFLDGDGSISKEGHTIFYGTSFALLSSIKNLMIGLGCSKKANIFTVIPKNNKKVLYYHLCYARKNSSNIIYPYLYTNSSICIDRKKQRFVV
jgi:hypothetical protein